MRKIALRFFLIGLLGLIFEADSIAEQWIPLQKHAPVAFYDHESIQYPYKNVYDLGLFTVQLKNKDIVRVWTKLDLNEPDVPNILYEIKFSSRTYRAIYSVNQYGETLPPYDSAYKPILPGSLEEDLYEAVRKKGEDPVLKK